MAGTIMPCPKFTGLDNNGDPLSGGKLYTYAAGTTTPQDTYSDVGLSVANTNPVILDSGGRATVFLSNSSYKFVLKDSADVTIWTQDNISAFNPTNLDIEGTVGEAVTAGQLVYLSDGSGGKTAGKWYLADADFDYASSLPTIAVVTVSAAINASASLRMQGSYTYGSALVAGSSYYVSGTAGALATTPGTYSRFVGICEVDGFTLVFSPNPPNIALSPTFGTVTATQAFVLGSATTNGIRMDLNSGTMEIREGDDSAYGPLNVGTTQVSGDLKPLANDGGSLGVSGTAWSDAYLASGGVIDWNAGNTTLTQSAGKLTLAGSGAGALDVKGTTAPVSNDGAALGVSGRAWSDAYLASGGVIDWNAGDTTLTQSAGKLTISGSGAGALDVKGTLSPTANDGAALGSGTVSWSDLFLASGSVINFNNGDVTETHSANTLTWAGASTGYVFNDGPVTLSAGAAGTPSLTTSGDLNTGLYFPAADTLGLTTGGTERVVIDSSGNVGIAATPGVWDSNYRALRVADVIALWGDARTTSGSDLFLTNNVRWDGSVRRYITSRAATEYKQVTGEHYWYNAPSGTAGNTITLTERLRLSSTGVLILGSGEASATVSGNTFRAPNAAGTDIAGANLTITSGNGTGTGGSGYIAFQTASAGSTGTTANTMTERLRITSAGNLAIAATARLYLDGVAASGNTYIQESAADTLDLVAGGTTTGRFTSTALTPGANDGAALGSGTVSWSDLFLSSGGVINFANGDVTQTHGSDTLTFAGAASGYNFNDGQVIVTKGTTSEDKVFISGTGGTANNYVGLLLHQGGSNTAPLYSGGMRLVMTASSPSFLDPALTFVLQGSGTSAAASIGERARISSGGYFKAADNGTYVGATGTYHEFDNTANNHGILTRCTNASQTATVFTAQAARNTTNGTFNAIDYYNTGAGVTRFIVADSGNVTNTNNSYGQISDQKLKQDIIDAASQWDDIKQVRVRKFRFKNEPAAPLQIGVVAQELEQVSPGLVEERPDYDREGTDLGTTTKSVKYSVLYMKAIKALQEAMARIEALEARLN